MSARYFCPPEVAPVWQAGATFDLSAAVARHVQVRRSQPGDTLVLFNGHGGEWQARITAMTRHAVAVELLDWRTVATELPGEIHLAVGMPANERMDALVEKATELGAAVIWPLHTQRSVLRLEGERAVRKIAHWQAVAESAAEQSGRDRVLQIQPVHTWSAWWQKVQPGLVAGTGAFTGLLSLAPGVRPWWSLAAAIPPGSRVLLASGPEGGLDAAEMALALSAGATPVTLGARVLRADTAPLQALGALALRWAVQ